MTGSPPHAAQAPVQPHTRVQTKLTIADGQQMVSLLGSHDEILKLIGGSVGRDTPGRGNEITIPGKPADNVKAERIFGELIDLIEKGEPLPADGARRPVGMIEQGTAERPAE